MHKSVDVDMDTVAMDVKFHIYGNHAVIPNQINCSDSN